MKATKSPARPASALRRRAQLALGKAAPAPVSDHVSAPGSSEASAQVPADELLHELQVHQVELQLQNEELRQAQQALEESRNRYVELFEFAPIGYLTLTRGGLIGAINLTGASLLGADRPKLIDHRFASFIAAPDKDRWQRLFAGLGERLELQHCEIRMQRVDGSAFAAQLDFQRSRQSPGSVRIALADVSERKRAEEDLRIAALAFDADVAVVVTDAQGAILRVNSAFTRLTGRSAEEVLGRTPAMLGFDGPTRDFEDGIRHALRQSGSWQGEVWNRSSDGRRYAAWLTICAVRHPDGATSHFVATCAEITKLKEAEAEVHRLAYLDPLTRLPNRRLLHDRIGQAMAASARSKSYGALIFVDLDHFKDLNDAHGHGVGDRLLIAAARRIQADLREADTVARLGGDEFVIMLELLDEDLPAAVAEAGRIAEKVRAALARPYELGRLRLRCTASLGVALFRGHGQSTDVLIRSADMAMYAAKNAGRNRLHFFPPPDEPARQPQAGAPPDKPD